VKKDGKCHYPSKVGGSGTAVAMGCGAVAAAAPQFKIQKIQIAVTDFIMISNQTTPVYPPAHLNNGVINSSGTENEMQNETNEYQRQLDAITPEQITSATADTVLPTFVVKYFKQIVTELSCIEKPKDFKSKSKKPTFWVAPFLKRKAGFGSLTEKEVENFIIQYKDIPGMNSIYPYDFL
jgi:hypothetical protein